MNVEQIMNLTNGQQVALTGKLPVKAVFYGLVRVVYVDPRTDGARFRVRGASPGDRYQRSERSGIQVAHTDSGYCLPTAVLGLWSPVHQEQVDAHAAIQNNKQAAHLAKIAASDARMAALYPPRKGTK
tara:strand:- start:14510 stop:14893 length:384 start_codon:yes stop_codon:yes gene_type:complete